MRVGCLFVKTETNHDLERKFIQLSFVSDLYRKKSGSHTRHRKNTSPMAMNANVYGVGWAYVIFCQNVQ